MMLAGFLFLLLVPGGSSAVYFDQPELDGSDYESNQTFEENPRLRTRNTDCNENSILEYLENQDKKLHSKTRPGRAKEPVQVYLNVLLYAIIDVNEKDQTFVSHVWIEVMWYRDLKWHPDYHCGVEAISHPIDNWWIPDVTIEEQMEKDKVVSSPYLIMNYFGYTLTRNTMTVVSKCKMHIYKFPWDVQSCNFTFKSAIFEANQLDLVNVRDPRWNMEWSRKMLIDGEWQLINMTINEKTDYNFGLNQSMLVYTITMKRNSALYVVTFLLPILFFLVLDMASFLISDSSGEKLGFKVTVLLAVTVMQLILIETLPSSSDRIPLIVTYCIGSFGLMMCSLLETIFVMYLMEKDHTSQDNKGSSSQMTEESHDFKLSDELNGAMKTLTVLHGTSKEEMKPGYWTMVAKNVNKTFFLLYFMVLILFLCYLFIIWTGEEK